jgi:hypothetical protein
MDSVDTEPVAQTVVVGFVKTGTVAQTVVVCSVDTRTVAQTAAACPADIVALSFSSAQIETKLTRLKGTLTAGTLELQTRLAASKKLFEFFVIYTAIVCFSLAS